MFPNLTTSSLTLSPNTAPQALSELPSGRSSCYVLLCSDANALQLGVLPFSFVLIPTTQNYVIHHKSKSSLNKMTLTLHGSCTLGVPWPPTLLSDLTTSSSVPTTSFQA